MNLNIGIININILLNIFTININKNILKKISNETKLI